MSDNHIKIPAVTPLVRYTANGIDTVFEFPFPIFASEDIKILLNGVRKIEGFEVNGAGNSIGGVITFDTAPSSGIVITILRQVPYERISDFIESGEFSAKSLNNELDYLMASVQQLQRDQEFMLRFSVGEGQSITNLPTKMNRQNKALGFDDEGNPIAIDYGLTQSPTSYTATGNGAIRRQITDKVSDIISIKDFGAIGDGVADDTLAFGKALSAHNHVFIPEGEFRITDTLQLGFGQTLVGAGQSSVIKADSNLFTALSIRNGYNTLSKFVIDGGDIGINLQGQDGPCVQNNIDNIVVRYCNTGITLNGGTDTNKPCYWNNFTNCLILSPSITGIELTKNGAGDTPNANIFTACRIYSQGTALSGHGINVLYGSFYNRFVNCEVNIDGTAQSCFTVGENANETIIENLYTESFNGVPNLHLKAGSLKTFISNLLAMSNGAALFDESGGKYQTINAGFPVSNRFGSLSVDDLTSKLMRKDTVYIDAPTSATLTMTMNVSLQLVAATNGEITINLPLPADYAGASYTIKKVDFTGNAVRLSEANGLGIDRKSEIILGGPYDYVTIISNGAEWFITSSNRMSGNTKFYDTTGQLDIDMAVDTYLISSFGGAVTCRLPPANAIEAVGRTITIKKTDNSSNIVYVSEQGGNGPDQYTQPLNSQYEAITITSNGGQWFIVSKF